ncbi:phosphoribosylanthranilate isomerase [Oharaeibacter diazotrophicus]|uniref:N-(5'-phosphoribosyl)anthranilate isomerase n=1 Tax=Oharaeibacter diazotrophicus TaxID=1920512 RepID=A0A4R6RDG7_9HYPH|nr:phosphoribosylanthranilate isomerase [Oharaeibacter diazotrophicus]TDP84301.1 phosphoribosylanthranilate isomerase [Oharaeibacter diazotrophicus]BBE73338.1 N-(5'-phosphoribosyl) anthranilate isomerase [Pleomorphomonas sp. SM30]GLS75129.1 N-(5'-phosphoribosyl)anthranilate isomerase [Oharaeibacter diazotrophicus]
MSAPFLVKICGLSTPASIDAAVDAGADMIGLVHFARSPRHVDADAAARLADHARGRAAVVLLTVDADDALLDALVARIRPDVVQLHGREDVARVAAVRARTRLKVAKALGIASADDVDRARDHDRGSADYLLFDAKPPKDATRPGGLGAPFDWDLLAGAAFATPVLLSGGLGPTNVGEAVRRTRPAGVDVSSGVESAPGVKDDAKIRAFVAAARAAAAEIAPPEDAARGAADASTRQTRQR